MPELGPEVEIFHDSEGSARSVGSGWLVPDSNLVITVALLVKDHEERTRARPLGLDRLVDCKVIYMTQEPYTPDVAILELDLPADIYSTTNEKLRSRWGRLEGDGPFPCSVVGFLAERGGPSSLERFDGS